MSLYLRASDDALKSHFSRIEDGRDLAALLDVTYAQLIYCIHALGPRRYSQFSLRKRRGGSRIVREPHPSLKIVQQKLAQVFSALYNVKPCVHGFVRGRSIASNAEMHVRRKHVLNVDLQDFFPSINFGRVRGLFLSPPYGASTEVATVIAQLCTFKNQLPQGAPTSPILSNMICARMDTELMRLARQFRLVYTRYADDLTFSTSRPRFPAALAKLDDSVWPPKADAGPELRRVIESNGFLLNHSKTRLQHFSRRQEVTGLTVNRRANVCRAYVSQVRAMLHAWGKYGYEAAEAEFLEYYDNKNRAAFKGQPAFSRVVKGKLDFLAMVRGREDRVYRRLLEQYADLTPEFAARPIDRTQSANLERVRAATWVLECDETSRQGTAFALEGEGLVTCDHVVGPTTRAFRIDEPHLTYPVQVLARDADVDLAVLSIECPIEPVLRPSRTTAPEVGDPIFIAGFPNRALGDQNCSVHAGSITAFRVWHGVRRMLVDAPIVSGASGGPVVNRDYRVIGVAVTGADDMSRAHSTENHGVIPIAMLRSIRRPA